MIKSRDSPAAGEDSRSHVSHSYSMNEKTVIVLIFSPAGLTSHDPSNVTGNEPQVNSTSDFRLKVCELCLQQNSAKIKFLQ